MGTRAITDSENASNIRALDDPEFFRYWSALRLRRDSTGNGRRTRMTALTNHQKNPVTSDERSQSSISQKEKARRWDSLIRMLRRPEIRDVSLRHLSSHRRAVMMLLASREELPASLTAELKTYKFTLDTLYLEAIGGFEDIDGIINYLPTYITESAVGQLCQPASTDNNECS
jgi:hypothetical protein